MTIMSEPWMDVAALARTVSLTDLFATPRREFEPTRPGASYADAAFQPRLAVAHLDKASSPAAEDENPPIDLAAVREAELEAVRAEAFNAGYEAGKAENIEAVDAVLSECRALMMGLDDARTIDKAALGPLLRNAVVDLVSQIVDGQVSSDPAFVNACVGRVLTAMKEKHEPARMYLHPDDIANIGQEATEGYRNLTIHADAELPRGSVRLETGGGEVEDGVRARIRRLEKALRTAGLAA